MTAEATRLDDDVEATEHVRDAAQEVVWSKANGESAAAATQRWMRRVLGRDDIDVIELDDPRVPQETRDFAAQLGGGPRLVIRGLARAVDEESNPRPLLGCRFSAGGCDECDEDA